MSRSLLKNSSIYGAGAVLNKALGFLLIPLYTRFLTVADYGVLALLNLTLQLLNFLFLMGVSSAAMRYYFDPDADEEYRQRVYGTALLLLLVLPLLACAMLLPAGGFLAGALLPRVPLDLLVLVVALALFSPAISLLSGLLRVQGKARAFVAFQLGLFLLQTVAIIATVGVFGWGLLGQLGGRLFAFVVFWGVAVTLVARQVRLRLDWPMARRLLALGLPLIPFFVFAWMNKSAGRFLLEHFGSLEEVGIFALAAQFAGLLILLGNATDNAVMPHFYDTAGRPGAARPLGVLATKFAAGFGLLGLYAMAAAEPLILLVADPAYHEAVRYVPLLTLAGWLYIAAKPFTWSLTYGKRTGTLSTIWMAVFAVSLSLLIVLLWELGWGIRGVVASMLAANTVLLVWGYVAGRRAVRLLLDWPSVALLFAVILAGTGALHFLGSDRITLGNTLAKLAVVAAATVAVARIARFRLPRLAVA